MVHLRGVGVYPLSGFAHLPLVSYIAFPSHLSPAPHSIRAFPYMLLSPPRSSSHFPSCSHIYALLTFCVLSVLSRWCDGCTSSSPSGPSASFLLSAPSLCCIMKLHCYLHPDVHTVRCVSLIASHILPTVFLYPPPSAFNVQRELSSCLLRSLLFTLSVPQHAQLLLCYSVFSSLGCSAVYYLFPKGQWSPSSPSRCHHHLLPTSFSIRSLFTVNDSAPITKFART